LTLLADLQDLHLTVFHTDLRDHTADRSWQLPAPATFVIDRNGVGRTAHASADYRSRTEPGDVVATLDELTF
jgi:peroxiredoxin